MAKRKTKQPPMVVNLWLIVLFVSRLKALSASVHSDDSIPGMRTHKRQENRGQNYMPLPSWCKVQHRSKQNTLTKNKAEKSCCKCSVSV